MKADIHPEYRPVLFRDLASGKVFLTRSTMTSDKTEKWEDGNELRSRSPLSRIRSTPVSSVSWTPQVASNASTHVLQTLVRKRKT